MPVIKKQYYGIKFPFTSNNLNGFFLDLNHDLKEKVESEIAHVILTPKGSRLRNPEFGTGLARYIFDPNDDITWDDVKSEAINAVSKYVKDVQLENISVVQNTDDDKAIYLTIYYMVKKGVKEEHNSTIIKL